MFTKPVDEVTVQDEGHVVEGERFEGFTDRIDLLVRCRAGNGFDEFLEGYSRLSPEVQPNNR